MSFWIHAFCVKPVDKVTPAALRAGIAQRLALLTALFCPENEENPAAVLGRLRIEPLPPNESLASFAMYYDTTGSGFIRIDRNDRTAVDEIEANVLSQLKSPKANDIKNRLACVTESVSFCLKTRDVQGMGYPLSIAAAAYLVEYAGGLIQTGCYSWMVPLGNEVETLLEVDSSSLAG